MAERPKRSTGEIGALFAEFGLQVESGVKPQPFAVRLRDRYPGVRAVHRELANQLATTGEAVMSFNADVVRFLIDQGIGSQFVMRIDPKTGRTGEQGRTIDMFTTVDADTIAATDPKTLQVREELRLTQIVAAGFAVPVKYDPHLAETSVEPDNVEVSLGSVATLERGLHQGTSSRTTQPGHNLSVFGRYRPDTAAGREIATQRSEQQPHFTDGKQVRGGEGLLVAMSTTTNDKNVFDDPLKRWPAISPEPLPAWISNFQLVVPDYLLEKTPDKTLETQEEQDASINRWFGPVNMEPLLKGEIRLVKADDTTTVQERQVIAYSGVLRQGALAVQRFTSDIKYSLEQKGYANV